jgi:predicted nucleic acid-binding protein
MASLRVVLDANVLWPMVLRDSLFRLATPDLGLYEPVWSDPILDEMTRTIIAAGKSSRERLERTVSLMNATFPDSRAEVGDTQGIELPDPGDVHVLAVARSSGSDYLVTFNVRHFPTDVCDELGLEVLDPDQFFVLLYQTAPEDVLLSLASQVAGYRQPPTTFAALLASLHNSGLHGFVFTVQQEADLRDLELLVDELRRSADDDD